VKKLLKKVSVFLLWLAALTITVHLIIPHDHHSADSSVSQENSCPASDHKSDHHSGFPFHCHAFNDLTSERSRPLLLTDYFQFSFLRVNFLTDTPSLLLPCSLISREELSQSLPDLFFLTSSLFRGPPSLA